MNSRNRKLLAVAWIQGLFYLLTGLWSLVDIHSFMVVTGPKTDIWLVRTVGLLVAVTGLLLLRSAKRGRVSPDLIAVAVGQAVVLTGIDIFYVSIGRISWVYLLDAGAEIALICAWLWSCRQSRPEEAADDAV